jgi:hypothetical protein
MKTGSLLRAYHIPLGWILTAIWVGGFTGLLKRRAARLEDEIEHDKRKHALPAIKSHSLGPGQAPYC